MSTARLKQVNFDTHIKTKSISIPDTKTGDSGTAMLPKKGSNFKDTRQTISVPLAMSTNLRKNVSNIWKKTEKKIPG